MPRKTAASSYAAEVIADDSGKWAGNALRFATKGEAEESAKDLFRRWMPVRKWRVVSSRDPVNYRWDDDLGRAVRIEED